MLFNLSAEFPSLETVGENIYFGSNNAFTRFEFHCFRKKSTCFVKQFHVIRIFCSIVPQHFLFKNQLELSSSSTCWRRDYHHRRSAKHREVRCSANVLIIYNYAKLFDVMTHEVAYIGRRPCIVVAYLFFVFLSILVALTLSRSWALVLSGFVARRASTMVAFADGLLVFES